MAVVALMLPSPQSAEAGYESPAQARGASGGLAPAGLSSSQVSVAVVQPSPSQCRGRADYPHQSSHQKGTLSGEATTYCKLNVPYLLAKAQLWERRWWGYDPDRDSGCQEQAALVQDCDRYRQRGLPEEPCSDNRISRGSRY
jgi:hypothetical protein